MSESRLLVGESRIAVSRLRLLHKLVGLGTALCAKYDEPDKWLCGPCDCVPGPPIFPGTTEKNGCPEVRELLALVRASQKEAEPRATERERP